MITNRIIQFNMGTPLLTGIGKLDSLILVNLLIRENIKVGSGVASHA